MAQRLRSRATAAVAAGLAATCIGVAAAPAFADTVRNQEWWLTSLHVTKAWLSSRGAGVTVAVLDTGVDTTQPDLAGSVTTGRDFTGSGRTAGGPFWGVHGTAVASLIAGHGHGPHHADGIIGVAPLAKILSVRVTLENKDPLLANPAVVAALPTAIARGIRYAVRHGAQVIDLPLDPAAQAGGTTVGGSPQERSAVREALAKGVVLVAPSGDNGAGTDTVNYPAAYHGVISVGAFGQGFVKAPFTSLQPYATLTAAGNGVIAANGPAGYAKMKSTSAASAVVAGIAALIRSQFPTFTPAQVEQALTTSTVFQPQERPEGRLGVRHRGRGRRAARGGQDQRDPDQFGVASGGQPDTARRPEGPRAHQEPVAGGADPGARPRGPGAARAHHPDHRPGPAAARARRPAGPVAGCGAGFAGAVGGQHDWHGQPRSRLRPAARCRHAGPRPGQQRARGPRPGQLRPGQHRTGQHWTGQHRTGQHRAGWPGSRPAQAWPAPAWPAQVRAGARPGGPRRPRVHQRRGGRQRTARGRAPAVSGAPGGQRQTTLGRRG